MKVLQIIAFDSSVELTKHTIESSVVLIKYIIYIHLYKL